MRWRIADDGAVHAGACSSPSHTHAWVMSILSRLSIFLRKLHTQAFDTLRAARGDDACGVGSTSVEGVALRHLRRSTRRVACPLDARRVISLEQYTRANPCAAGRVEKAVRVRPTGAHAEPLTASTVFQIDGGPCHINAAGGERKSSVRCSVGVWSDQHSGLVTPTRAVVNTPFLPPGSDAPLVHMLDTPRAYFDVVVDGKALFVAWRDDALVVLHRLGLEHTAASMRASSREVDARTVARLLHAHQLSAGDHDQGDVVPVHRVEAYRGPMIGELMHLLRASPDALPTLAAIEGLCVALPDVSRSDRYWLTRITRGVPLAIAPLTVSSGVTYEYLTLPVQATSQAALAPQPPVAHYPPPAGAVFGPHLPNQATGRQLGLFYSLHQGLQRCRVAYSPVADEAAIAHNEVEGLTLRELERRTTPVDPDDACGTDAARIVHLRVQGGSSGASAVIVAATSPTPSERARGAIEFALDVETINEVGGLQLLDDSLAAHDAQLSRKDGGERGGEPLHVPASYRDAGSVGTNRPPVRGVLVGADPRDVARVPVLTLTAANGAEGVARIIVPARTDPTQARWCHAAWKVGARICWPRFRVAREDAADAIAAGLSAPRLVCANGTAPLRERAAADAPPQDEAVVVVGGTAWDVLAAPRPVAPADFYRVRTDDPLACPIACLRNAQAHDDPVAHAYVVGRMNRARVCDAALGNFVDALAPEARARFSAHVAAPSQPPADDEGSARADGLVTLQRSMHERGTSWRVYANAMFEGEHLRAGDVAPDGCVVDGAAPDLAPSSIVALVCVCALSEDEVHGARPSPHEFWALVRAARELSASSCIFVCMKRTTGHVSVHRAAAPPDADPDALLRIPDEPTGALSGLPSVWTAVAATQDAPLRGGGSTGEGRDRLLSSTESVRLEFVGGGHDQAAGGGAVLLHRPDAIEAVDVLAVDPVREDAEVHSLLVDANGALLASTELDRTDVDFYRVAPPLLASHEVVVTTRREGAAHVEVFVDGGWRLGRVTAPMEEGGEDSAVVRLTVDGEPVDVTNADLHRACVIHTTPLRSRMEGHVRRGVASGVAFDPDGKAVERALNWLSREQRALRASSASTGPRFSSARTASAAQVGLATVTVDSIASRRGDDTAAHDDDSSGYAAARPPRRRAVDEFWIEAVRLASLSPESSVAIDATAVRRVGPTRASA